MISNRSKKDNRGPVSIPASAQTSETKRMAKTAPFRNGPLTNEITCSSWSAVLGRPHASPSVSSSSSRKSVLKAWSCSDTASNMSSSIVNRIVYNTTGWRFSQWQITSQWQLHVVTMTTPMLTITIVHL